MSKTRNSAAIYFQYSVARIAVLGVATLAVLIAELFPSCHCIPVASRQITGSEPWWCGPCEYEHKTRHSRGINNPVRDQFNIAIGNYENIISKYVKQIQTKLQIENMTKKQLKRNNWLPRKKFFKTLRKNDEKILPELHRQVQIYAVTIQRLLDMEIRSQDGLFNWAKRMSILTSVKSDINLLRCEIELEISEKQLTPPVAIQENIVDKKIPTVVDHLTDVLIRDYTILKDYSNFLNKCSNKIFGKEKKMKRSNKKGVKKNNKGKNKKRTKPKSEQQS